jgi:hypothetical protein
MRRSRRSGSRETAVERALADADGVNEVLLQLRGAVDTVRTSRTPR